MGRSFFFFLFLRSRYHWTVYWKMPCMEACKQILTSLQWRHNEHTGISNCQHLDCSLNHLFRCRSTETSKLCVTGLYEGNSPMTDKIPTHSPITCKLFPCDDVIMFWSMIYLNTDRWTLAFWVSPVQWAVNIPWSIFVKMNHNSLSMRHTLLHISRVQSLTDVFTNHC